MDTTAKVDSDCAAIDVACDLCDPRLACHGVTRLDAHTVSKGSLVFIVLPPQLFYLFYVYINF